MSRRWLCLLLLLLSLPGTSLAAPTGAPLVAVLYFDYQGKDEELVPLKKGLASMLISDLSGNEAIRVVERERLEDVLAELKLQSSAKIDQASAVKAGKLLGAHYLVLGGYFDVMKKLRIDARVVEVETGKVMVSVGATGQPDDFLTLEQKLATDLGRHFSAGVLPAPTTTKAAVAKGAAAKGGAPKVAPEPPSPKPVARPRPPKQLPVKTAVEYGRALSAIDAKDLDSAKSSLKKVVAAAPDFELASLDLNRLMKQ